MEIGQEEIMEMQVETDEIPEFTLAEVLEMERSFKEKGGEQLTQKFYQELAKKFSCSTLRSGKSLVKWEQVQSWFQEKQEAVEAKLSLSSIVLGDLVTPINEKISKNSNRSPSKVSYKKPKVPLHASIPRLATKITAKSTEESARVIPDLLFEARSAKDLAWFDVASFLNYRVLNTGELEVRVRFAGFGKDEDEWVNVERAVRERSVPLEPSECGRVKVGDNVLCYRANDDHALYSDAHVVEIQRGIHDDTNCSCVFVVNFEYDNSEAGVHLGQICCRPS